MAFSDVRSVACALICICMRHKPPALISPMKRLPAVNHGCLLNKGTNCSQYRQKVLKVNEIYRKYSFKYCTIHHTLLSGARMKPGPGVDRQ